MIRIYDNPTLRSYLTLLRLEAMLVQTAELLEKKGHHVEKREILQAKKAIRIRRVCMKGALRLKEAQLKVS
ncbi:hypothetical protein [Halalkalibacterium ligniniphilum]|uniref:hypothetical protein n=1 Tax=Halalkalibacterium ligniniphilum TaxID=1134413 RepID=UPI00035C3A67|nr:hypothetical protein [Halalkalibacterium ligniniphilum]